MRRFWLPYTCYYVTMRGNNRQPIFHTSNDYNKFIRIIRRASKESSFHLLAYCILDNQYHILIRSSQHPLPEIMLLINKTYSRYYKQKYRWTGQLYESNFFTSIIQTESELLKIVNFMYEQPLLAGITAKTEAYPYISFSLQTSRQSLPDLSFILHPKQKSKIRGSSKVLNMHTKTFPL